MPNPRDKILILGTGHVGCALAADLESRDPGSTILYAAPGHDRLYHKLLRQNSLPSHLALTGTFHPELTQDLPSALSRSWLAIVAVPATGQEDILALLSHPSISGVGGETLLLFNSGRLVSPLAAQRLRGTGFKNILETAKSPYSSRVEEGADGRTVQVRINAYKRRLHIAGLEPISPFDRARLDRVFPMRLVYVPNVLQLFLLGQYFIHIATVLSNLSPIENGEPKKFYSGMMSRGVCTLAEHAHGLALDVAENLGWKEGDEGGMETMLQAFQGDYGYQDVKGLGEFVRDCAELNRRAGLPKGTNARQLDEDVGYYAVMVVDLADKLGVKGGHLDVVRGWVASAGVLNGRDYMATGRRLRHFGLEGEVSRERVLEVFNAGGGVGSASSL